MKYNEGRLGFRRATHDAFTGDYLDKFRSENISEFQKQVWDAHGSICHLLDSRKAMSLEDLLEEIRKDKTNYTYLPYDLKGWIDGEPMPTPQEVCVSLVRLVEAGFVEMRVL
jgi:hypothetical protein